MPLLLTTRLVLAGHRAQPCFPLETFNSLLERPRSLQEALAPPPGSPWHSQPGKVPGPILKPRHRCRMSIPCRGFREKTGPGASCS